jgi:FMN phosphatase YigB (HAD superfamily)
MTQVQSAALSRVVFLFDVDDTLLDNDTAQNDYLIEIGRVCGPQAAKRYWEIFQQLAKELGYADYLGALEKYRLEDMHDPRLLRTSSYLLDYPFRDRLYPKSLDVITHLGRWGRVVILSDGDVVFQPRKIERSALWDAVSGNVLIYIHKEQELDDVARRYPAEHYVMADDKLRILAAMKQSWGHRLTTVWPKQGHYATDPHVTSEYPPADISIDRIGDLLNFNLGDLTRAAKAHTK